MPVSVEVTKTDGGVILVAPSLKFSSADDAAGLLKVEGSGSNATPSFIVSLPNDPVPSDSSIISIRDSSGNSIVSDTLSNLTPEVLGNGVTTVELTPSQSVVEEYIRFTPLSLELILVEV